MTYAHIPRIVKGLSSVKMFSYFELFCGRGNEMPLGINQLRIVEGLEKAPLGMGRSTLI